MHDLLNTSMAMFSDRGVLIIHPKVPDTIDTKKTLGLASLG